MESPGTGRKAATSNVDPFGLLIEYQFNYKKNMRYGTPETASASNTTHQLANMLGTANKFRKQITDVKQSIRGSNMIKNMRGGGNTSSPSKHRMMLDTTIPFALLREEKHSKQEHE